MMARLTRFVLMSLGISAGEEERQRRAEQKWSDQREFARREEEAMKECAAEDEPVGAGADSSPERE